MSPKTQSWLSQICAVIGLAAAIFILLKLRLDWIAGIFFLIGAPATIFNLFKEATMKGPYIQLPHEEGSGGKSAVNLLEETPVFCGNTRTRQENLEGYQRDLERERAAAYYRELEERGRHNH